MAAYPPPYPPPENSSHPMAPGYGAQPAPPPPYQHGGPVPVVQHNTHTTAVVVTSPVVVATGIKFGESPVPMTCYYCSSSIVTGTNKKVGSFAWMVAGGIFLVGCFVMGVTWCGCCLIPFCIDSMKDTEHFCPNCSRLLGKHPKVF